MTANLDRLGLAIASPLGIPTSQSYRPPCWPPPKDWVCIEDREGNPVSRYGDHIWNLWPWTGTSETFNFFDGPKIRSGTRSIDPANAELLRQLMVFRGWGVRGSIRPGTFVSFGKRIRRIIAFCSDNKILASNLSRFPALIDKVAQLLSPSTYEDTVADLERIREAREFLAFELLDEWALRRLKAAQPEHYREQTEYIPPRIWTYVVNRMGECVDDYLKHQQKVEECFAFCINLYENNRVFETRAKTGKASKNNPFQSVRNYRNGKRTGFVFLGPFMDTAQRFGIRDVIGKWIGTTDTDIQVFGKYLSVVQFAALTDVVAFTLMRIDEASSIRADCVVWHDDPVYGRIPLIRGKTTKTDPDDEALWVTSPSVPSSIRAMSSITKLRFSRTERVATDDNPYLMGKIREPWAPNGSSNEAVKVIVSSFGRRIIKYPHLLDSRKLAVTEEDLRLAKAVCPTLNSELFQVGKPWPLAWHQFRRTCAVNMFSSGEISDSTMQLQMKHLTRLMPLYYGRGNTSLHLDDATRILLVNAQYESMGRQLAEVFSDKYVSPYGDEHKANLLVSANDGEPVRLISDSDARRYETAARKHQVNFRLTALGGCMKNGACDGDCVSSVSDCAGGDGKPPCSNALFNKNRAEANRIRLGGVIEQLESAPPDTPRYRHLEQERRGLENYFAYIK